MKVGFTVCCCDLHSSIRSSERSGTVSRRHNICSIRSNEYTYTGSCVTTTIAALVVYVLVA
jgi:hypothetical protein